MTLQEVLNLAKQLSPIDKVSRILSNRKSPSVFMILIDKN